MLSPDIIPTVKMATSIFGANTVKVNPVVRKTPPAITPTLQLNLLMTADDSGAEKNKETDFPKLTHQPDS